MQTTKTSTESKKTVKTLKTVKKKTLVKKNKTVKSNKSVLKKPFLQKNKKWIVGTGLAAIVGAGIIHRALKREPTYHDLDLISYDNFYLCKDKNLESFKKVNDTNKIKLSEKELKRFLKDDWDIDI